MLLNPVLRFELCLDLNLNKKLSDYEWLRSLNLGNILKKEHNKRRAIRKKERDKFLKHARKGNLCLGQVLVKIFI